MPSRIRGDGRADSYFTYLLRQLLPAGGYVVAFSSFYIDESGTHDGAPFLCLAGFLFEDDAARDLNAAWDAILKREGIPYIHMADWTKPNQAPYAHMDMPKRIEVQKELISLIQQHRRLIVAATVCESEYLACWDEAKIDSLNRSYLRRSAYSHLAIRISGAIYEWLRHNHPDRKVAYFYERGHKDQGFLNAALLDRGPAEIKPHIGSHTFLDKEDAGALQAADMLAWLVANYVQKCKSKNLRPGSSESTMCARADLRALMTTEAEKQDNLFMFENHESLMRVFRIFHINAGAAFIRQISMSFPWGRTLQLPSPSLNFLLRPKPNPPG